MSERTDPVVAFHVEIRRSLHRARVFNLSEDKLRRTVIEPWRQGGPVDLGDQQWDPGESTLRILEGPELSQPDLALGKGWSNADRSATDVTTRVLREAAAETVLVTVLAETPSGHETATRLLTQIGVRTADWAAVRARILAAATVVPTDPRQSAQVLVALLLVERCAPTGAWLFEAGLALGALGDRALVAQLGDEPPPAELRDLDVFRLDPDQPASLHALAERLRHAGGSA
jgi:hypothetical protein